MGLSLIKIKKWIYTFSVGRTQKVIVNESKLEKVAVTSLILQRTFCLAPMLFIIIVANIDLGIKGCKVCFFYVWYKILKLIDNWS